MCLLPTDPVVARARVRRVHVDPIAACLREYDAPDVVTDHGARGPHRAIAALQEPAQCRRTRTVLCRCKVRYRPRRSLEIVEVSRARQIDPTGDVAAGRKAQMLVG